MKKNGFTLIELLAVIVILSILMVLAVTGFTTVMNNSRKDTFYTTAEQFLDAVRIKVLSGDYDSTAGLESGNCLVVPITQIELESGNYESPFGYEFDTNYSYVVVTGSLRSSDYKYSIQLIDSNNNGFRLTSEAEFSTKEPRNFIEIAADIPANNDSYYVRYSSIPNGSIGIPTNLRYNCGCTSTITKIAI